ncbi:MAG: SUMF1/EgtB/PvdO family nonheme iron enzyme, partial [Bacteroidetes bacterium]|nr:SUMF1/EgtB/PvdO family nonheme iron enzyme [Bacteroidota bacterium]
LLTDGYATGNAVAIFEMARQVAAEVYCVTMEDRMPDLLAQLCDITGGRSYAGVKTADDARMIFRTIVSTVQEDEPCMIEWESEGCDYARRVVLELPAHGVHSVGEYSVDRSMLPELEFLPSSVIEIGAVPPGSTGQAFCTIRAINRSVYVDSIAVSDARFFIADYGGNPPPFSLPPGKTRTLTLSYRALDSSRATCRFTLESNACRPEFFASAGFPGKCWDHRTITLLHPNGGELFIAGSDTVISWEGVAPDEPVRLEFSADNGRSWQSVVKGATGLEYKWRVPVVASDECLVRVTVEEKDPVPDDMVLLGRGRLRMGDMVGTGTALERPVHDVFIDRPFLISVTVITQRAFIDVMGYNPSIMTGSDLLPVNGVSWYMAVEYCNARSRLEGLEECYVLEGEDVTCNFQAKGYRLPTEAEWEYACRANGNLEFTGGGMREPYCTPVDPTLDTLGWYCGNTAALQDVSRRRPNAFGLYDMHGNVQEWCWDYLNVYDPSETIDPSGPPIPSQPFYRVVRGGLYSSYATGCRSSSRDGAHAKMSGMVGFRVVRTY